MSIKKSSEPNQNKHWDPVVKLTHWGVALAVIANALFTEEGSGWHVWVGYTLAGLLLLRWLWGIIGTENARFLSFPPNPARALRYLKGAENGQPKRHDSHNPLGTLMVYALWSCLAAIIASGIAMAGPPPANPNVRESGGRSEPVTANAREETGDEDEEDDETSGEASALAGDGNESGEDALEEVHEIAVNLLYVLILLHISGVLVETARRGRGTLGAMIPLVNRKKP